MPFGCYYWERMLFGIKSAPEVWQRKAHEFIEGLDGVEVVTDDFLVVGCGDTVEVSGPISYYSWCVHFLRLSIFSIISCFLIIRFR